MKNPNCVPVYSYILYSLYMYIFSQFNSSDLFTHLFCDYICFLPPFCAHFWKTRKLSVKNSVSMLIFSET